MMATVSAIESFPTNDDIFDAEVDDDSDGGQEENNVQTPNNEVINSVDEDKPPEKDDIFDDEGSPQVEESPDESEKENEDDEEASKSSKEKRARSPKPRKIKKAAIQSIHSECQRMLRDATVKLPYYTPAVKPITHFLKRVPMPTVKSSESKTKKDPVQESSKTEDVTSTQSSESNGDKEARTPKLSDANDPFFFDETPTASLPTKGVQKLMQRFAKHTKKPKETTKTESIVILDDESKEKASQAQPLKKPDTPIPGGRLKSLKEQLEAKMKRQREELRKIHESQRKLDNEEISGDEEEEEEMTDESDSDYELDRWNAEDEKKQEEEENDDQDDDKSAQNEFIDAEANDDDDFDAVDDNSGSDGDVSDEGQSDNDDENSSNNDKTKQKLYKIKKHKKSKDHKDPFTTREEKSADSFNVNSNSQTFSEESQNNVDNGQSLRLRLDSIEDDDDSAVGFTKMRTLKSPEGSLSLQLASDLTDDSSRIEPGQAGGAASCYQESDSEVSSMLPPIARNSSNKENPKLKKKLSQLTLPIEDSQDLFDEGTLDTEPQDKVSVSNGFSFGIDEESQFSQLLDTQGFLFSTKKQKKQNPNNADVAAENTESGMEEILGLCSGQFTGITEPKSFPDTSKRKPKSLLGTLIIDENSHSSNMDELLGLCCGMFGSKNETKMFSAEDDKTNDSKETENDGDMLANNDDNGDDDENKEDDDNDDDDDDENGGEGDDNHDDKENYDSDINEEEEEDNYVNRLTSKKKHKTKKIFDKKKFYEEEAELSGSDIGSDEDDDIDTDDDILEEDSGQEELPSDEELQNQINRVHMKSILDQDKAELRLMQDIYLQDGDLHGEGRKRNFRWRGIDFNSQADLFDNRMWNDEDENANIELLTEEESKRRKERFERDSFLREEMQKGTSNHAIVDMDENSQTILNIIKDTSNAAPAASPTVPDKPQPAIICKKPATPAPRLQRIPSQKGSFLNRSKATLNRLSSITASTPNASSTGRSFVFKAVDGKEKTESAKSKMPRTVSMQEPAAKRPKFDRSMSDTASNSIFSMF